MRMVVPSTLRNQYTLLTPKVEEIVVHGYSYEYDQLFHLCILILLRKPFRPKQSINFCRLVDLGFWCFRCFVVCEDCKFDCRAQISAVSE